MRIRNHERNKFSRSKLGSRKGNLTARSFPAGEPWIHAVKKGQHFALSIFRGNQAVDTLFYNAHDYYSDRYTAPQITIQQQTNIISPLSTKFDFDQRHRCCSRSWPTRAVRHDTLGGACATESNMVALHPRKTAHARIAATAF